MWRRGRRSRSFALVPVFGLTHPHIFSLSAPRTRCNFVPLAVRCSRSGHKLAVVPANAGTHNHRLEFVALAVRLSFQQKISRGMGPCVRRDDGERVLACMVRDGASRLLTMRVWHVAACSDLVLRSALARVSKDGPHKERRHNTSFSRRMASEFCNQLALEFLRGRREGRVPFAPMVRVQQKSTRQNHRYEPDHPAFPARLALRLIRALPGDRRSCPRRLRCASTAPRT